MEILVNNTVANVVSDNIKAAHIFKKYGIDFCCGGGATLEKACAKKNVNVERLIKELNNLNEIVLPSQNYNNWAIDYLVEHLIHTHHAYIKDSISVLQAYAEKVVKVHSNGHPPTIKIKELQMEVLQELMTHLQKEEMILFPFIKKLVLSSKGIIPYSLPSFDTVGNPIRMMEADHEKAGILFDQIEKLSNNYNPPEWACNTFKAWYSKLEEFEQDLHLHVHLENNILFPKAIILEKELQSLVTR